MEFSFSLVARSIRLDVPHLGLINPDCPAFKEYVLSGLPGKTGNVQNFQTINEGQNWVWMCHGLARVPKGKNLKTSPLRSLRSQTFSLVDILPLRRIVGRINATPRGDPTARDILGGAGAFEGDWGSIEVRRFVFPCTVPRRAPHEESPFNKRGSSSPASPFRRA